MRGLSPVAASGDHSSSRCAGLSPSRPLLLRSTGSRRAGSATVAHGPSCSVACGIFPDQGSNPCPLHWQADSQPLRHQGSPVALFKRNTVTTCLFHLTMYLFFKHLYWSIIALQWCVSFCFKQCISYVFSCQSLEIYLIILNHGDWPHY